MFITKRQEYEKEGLYIFIRFSWGNVSVYLTYHTHFVLNREIKADSEFFTAMKFGPMKSSYK